MFAGGNIDILVQNGAVDALVPHLSAPPLLHRDDHVAYEHEVEKDAAFALGLLAIKVRGFTLLVVFRSRKPGATTYMSLCSMVLRREASP